MLSVTVWVGFEGGERSGRVSADTEKFSLKTPRKVDMISLVGPDFQHRLKKEDDVWMINDRYVADSRIITLMFEVMDRARVQRPVAKKNKEDVLKKLSEEGINATFYIRDEPVMELVSVGFQEENVSYFMAPDDSAIFVMTIPGYKSYLTGIFELSENQWRNRLTFNTSWRTLRKLLIEYPDDQANKSFTIKYGQDHLTIPSLNKYDTAKLRSFVERFNYLEVDGFISMSEHPRYDSLLRYDPVAKITVKDIDTSKHRTMDVYPSIPGDDFRLLVIDNTEYAVISSRRLETILKTRDYFIPSE